MLTAISFIAVLMLLIFVHELGHFSAAKYFGVRVERFSLGFPPKIWSRTIGETEYQLAWLPLGGYVKLFGEDPNDVAGMALTPEERRRSYSHRKPLVRAAIIFAGPLFNIIFAGLVMWGLAWAEGVPHLRPLVGQIEAGGAAAAAGLATGDQLAAVDGQPIEYYDQVLDIMETKSGQALSLTVIRRGQESTLNIQPKMVEQPDIFGRLKSRPSLGFAPKISPVVGALSPGMPAEKAGLAPGDRILSVGGQPLEDWQLVVQHIRAQGYTPLPADAPKDAKPKAQALTLEVRRGEQVLEIILTPDLMPAPGPDGQLTYIPMIGIEPQDDALVEPLGFFAAGREGVVQAAGMLKITVSAVGMLLRGQMSAKTLGGPIFIAELVGQKARAGIMPLLLLAAFISINLGVLNLFPIPILDGGQLALLGVEAVRKRPLSPRLAEWTQGLGLALVLMLMVLVFYNDISRLIDRWQQPPPASSVTIKTPATEPAP